MVKRSRWDRVTPAAPAAPQGPSRMWCSLIFDVFFVDFSICGHKLKVWKIRNVVGLVFFGNFENFENMRWYPFLGEKKIFKREEMTKFCMLGEGS